MGHHGTCWSRAESGDHRSQLEDYLAFLHISGGGAAREWLAREPGVDRLVDGVPCQVEQLGGYGNAVIPAAAEHIGRLITGVAA